MILRRNTQQSVLLSKSNILVKRHISLKAHNILWAFFYLKLKLKESMQEINLNFRNFVIPLMIFAASTSAYSTELSTCEKKSDCILTNENFCERVTALNKKSLKVWLVEQNKQSSANPSQTCSPIPRQDLIKDYKVECVEKKCQETRITPW